MHIMFESKNNPKPNLLSVIIKKNADEWKRWHHSHQTSLCLSNLFLHLSNPNMFGQRRKTWHINRKMMLRNDTHQTLWHNLIPLFKEWNKFSLNCNMRTISSLCSGCRVGYPEAGSVRGCGPKCRDLQWRQQEETFHSHCYDRLPCTGATGEANTNDSVWSAWGS